jgi:aspartate aminotransferase
MKAFLSHIGAWAPMAEQKATAAYLLEKEVVEEHFKKFKAALELRLQKIYDGLIALKNEGFNVDAIAPQAAIYLTIKFDLVGKRSADGLLQTQEDVTKYLLSKAQLAVVPFYAFGAGKNSPWYRLSVGTCTIENIDSFLLQLKKALEVLQ